MVSTEIGHRKTLCFQSQHRDLDELTFERDQFGFRVYCRSIWFSSLLLDTVSEAEWEQQVSFSSVVDVLRWFQGWSLEESSQETT